APCHRRPHANALIFLAFSIFPARIEPCIIEVISMFCGAPHYFEAAGEIQETRVLGYPLKLLLNAIESRHGYEAVVQTLTEAGLPADRVYRLNESYTDSEAQHLITAALHRLSLEDVAEAFFKDTMERFPTWFAMCKTSRQFLEMQPEIHNTFAHGLLR